MKTRLYAYYLVVVQRLVLPRACVHHTESTESESDCQPRDLGQKMWVYHEQAKAANVIHTTISVTRIRPNDNHYRHTVATVVITITANTIAIAIANLTSVPQISRLVPL